MASVESDIGNGRFKIPISTVWKMLTVMFALVGVYITLSNKVTALDVEQRNMKEMNNTVTSQTNTRLDRIEAKIDRLMERRVVSR